MIFIDSFDDTLQFLKEKLTGNYDCFANSASNTLPEFKGSSNLGVRR